MLTGGPAAVDIVHPPSTATITIEYRTAGNQALRILDGQSEQELAVLPPAPNGRRAAVPLAGIPQTTADGVASILLLPDMPGGAQVTRLTLQ